MSLEASSRGRSGATRDVTLDPTPIGISGRTRTFIILGVLAAFALIVWQVPSVLTTALGGFALALVLSFPVRLLTRFVPRGMAIFGSLGLLIGLVALVVLVVAPLITDQVSALARSIPTVADDIQRYLNNLFDLLRRRGVLPGDPAEALSGMRQELSAGLRSAAESLLGGAFNLVSGTIGFAVTLFGVVFVGIYLLLDVRRMKAFYLLAAPRRYRRDARNLWNAFGYSLSRYLSGLVFILFVQGAISAVGLWLLGVPNAFALGAWVSVTAVVPYVGAYIGAVPAVLVALTISPTTALLTVLLYIAIQQIEGNFLTPRIQGDALRVHPVLVFLGVLVGGGLAGILGIVFATPALAVLRVLFDFFRVRLRTEGLE